MKYFILAIHIQLWILGSFDQRGMLLDMGKGIKTQITSAMDKIDKKVTEHFSTVLNNECVVAPEECPNKNITFWLYTRSNPDVPIKLSGLNAEVFDFPDHQLKLPWKIIIHGYTKSKDEIPNPQLRKEYFKKGEYNLISVDYEPLARNKCYLASVRNVPLIANCTAKMVENFFISRGISLKTVHVIGFSLGAQVAGQIYKYLSNNVTFGRVTGLDPAFPLFDGVINDKMSTKAGDFVDVIHTNALARGKLEKLGHVDFYVNGGFTQPGCSENEELSFATCNHNRAPEYYAESINSNSGFWGIPCDMTKYFTIGCSAKEEENVIMGEYTPFKTRGRYYLQTTSNSPFAMGRNINKRLRGSIIKGWLL